ASSWVRFGRSKETRNSNDLVSTPVGQANSATRQHASEDDQPGGRGFIICAAIFVIFAKLRGIREVLGRIFGPSSAPSSGSRANSHHRDTAIEVHAFSWRRLDDGRAKTRSALTRRSAAHFTALANYYNRY